MFHRIDEVGWDLLGSSSPTSVKPGELEQVAKDGVSWVLSISSF